jgi:hypothetical protein
VPCPALHQRVDADVLGNVVEEGVVQSALAGFHPEQLALFDQRTVNPMLGEAIGER